MWFEKLRFHDLIDRAAQRWGEREALICEGRRWTFAALRDEVERAGKALIAAGIEPGDHVCLWLGNRPEHVFLFFAIVFRRHVSHDRQRQDPEISAARGGR